MVRLGNVVNAVVEGSHPRNGQLLPLLCCRYCQKSVVVVFELSRIDEPFLAPNVALGPYKFDYVPLSKCIEQSQNLNC